MSSTSPVDAASAGADGSRLSSADILHSVYEAQAGSDPLGRVDLSLLQAQQLQEIQEALLRRGEALTQAEKRALESGETQEIRALLQRVRDRHQLQLRRHADGLTQTRSPRPATYAQKDHLPAREISVEELIHLIYESRDPGDALDRLDQRLLSAKQHKALEAALAEVGEKLTRADREAIESGLPNRLRRLLAKLLARRLRGQELTPAKLLHLIYEAHRTGQALLAELDLSKLSGAQLEELEAALTARGETLSDSDREAFKGRRLAEILKLLKRILERHVRGQPHQVVPSGPARGKAEGYRHLKVGVAVLEKEVLADTKGELLRQVMEPRAQRSVDKAMSGKAWGGQAPTFGFVGGLPAAGRSGEADRLPVMQFVPGPFQALLERLGIRTLVDFLARVSLPESRLLLGRTLGLPTTALMLAGQRAELLDLPINRPRATPPHLKDILLLAQLGAGSVGAFAKLATLFEQSPARLDLLAILIAKLQRICPDLVGRERITRHHLREWTLAAARRGSDLEPAARGADGHTEAEVAAEGVLTWYLENRWGHREATWDDLMIRLLTLLRIQGVAADEELFNEFLVEFGEERLELYRRLVAQDQERLDLERHEAEMARYAEYILKGEESSILMDLYPWMSPDESRTDNLVCFWVDPVPDARHQMGNGALPENLQAVYLCMDLTSGAVAPFGSGGAG